MELMHPAVVKIGIPVLILICIILHAVPALSKKKFSGGIRTGASGIVKSLPLYKKIIIRKKILTYINEAFVISAIISSLFLIARPYKVQSVNTGVQKRDIFLCLDVSYSLYDLNYELVDSLEKLVTELKGDRFGVTMFNSTSVVYVPMTDDYDYVIMRLEELKEYFPLQKEYYDKYVDENNYIQVDRSQWEEYMDLCNRLSYFESGTLVDLETKGSSVTGEGLASCLYSFPSIGDSSRTRVIIFATDNEKTGQNKQVPELDEAFALCKKNDVTVFSVYPKREDFFFLYTGQNYADWSNELRAFSQSTGGQLYIQTDINTMDKIVEKIKSHEAMTVDDIVTKRMTDLPVPGIIALLISLAGTCICLAFLKGK